MTEKNDNEKKNSRTHLYESLITHCDLTKKNKHSQNNNTEKRKKKQRGEDNARK